MVVGMRLGCLNHALLTAHAVRAAGLPLHGWVANHAQPQPMAYAEENIAALEERLDAPLLARVEHDDAISASDIAGRFDPACLR
jgi:dethiobiotin synthetase